MKYYFTGIDPGLGGAVAVISGLNNPTAMVYDTPIFKANKKRKKSDYDIKGMVELLKPYQEKKTYVVLESVFAMRSQGVTSTFNFGRGRGLWEGIAAALDYDLEMVLPRVWKAEFGDDLAVEIKEGEERKKSEIKKEAKTKARILAAKLYPDISDMFDRVRDDGRADALLIAEYKRRLVLNGDNK